MSDSEDELGLDISQWKPRTANTAAVTTAPRTFASINTPAPAHDTSADDDLDIDAIIEGIVVSDAESPVSVQPQEASAQRPRQEVQIIIIQDPNFDRDAYEDCTYGAEIVRHVKSESVEEDRVYYQVEFVDRHTEKVRYCLSLHLIISVLPLYNLLLVPHIDSSPP
jgi:chromodomain-helicase-DNA-binding protein 4